MNIVDMVKSQLTGDVLGKLGPLIGESEDKTRTAVEATVPGFLSVLAGLASSAGGAGKLIDALKQVDPGSQGGFGDILAGPQSTQVQQKGGNLLEILLGSGALPVLIGVLSKFISLNGETVKKLLSMLAPLILGTIAKQMSGKGLTSQAVSSFFSEQKANINAAMPQGLSLAGIPGLTPGPSASAAPADAGMPGWLLPLVGLGLLGALAWYFMGGQPAVEEKAADPPVVKKEPMPKIEPAAPKVEPLVTESTKFGADLSGLYGTLTHILGDVKDAASADAAVPHLTDLKPKLDAMKSLWEKLPDAGKTAVAKVTNDHLARLKELVARVLAVAGVSEKFKSTVDSVIITLSTFVTK